MTHIDPFAPADSPQHPANWVADALASGDPKLAGVPLKVLREDDAPAWIRIEGEPIRAEQPDADTVADARWEEYEQLLRQLGDPESIEYFERPTTEWPEGMPTLAELRGRVTQASAVPETDAAADLAAKLAALAKDGGL